MKDIQMVDLVGQYEHIKDDILHGMTDIIGKAQFINGPVVQEFSERLASYHGGGYVQTCGNGTDALQIALMALELKPGDEVITTPFTFVATVEVIALLGLIPKFVDANPYTFNIDESKIEQAITERTKAIIPVHLFGQACDMESIQSIAKTRNLFVIEDNAQSIGATFKWNDGSLQKVGTIGDISGTSFFPSKNLGAYGDGGALYTSSEQLFHKIRSICNHGSDVKYYHDNVGVNSRLDSIQAHVLNVKLNYLESYNAKRKAAADYYDHLLAQVEQVETPYRVSYSSHVFHQYTIKVPSGKREELVTQFKAKQIPFGIYYPVPLHLQNAYRWYGYHEGQFPVAEALSKQVFSLPMHTELTQGQQEYVCKVIRKVLG